jgi:hypothetical protein
MARFTAPFSSLVALSLQRRVAPSVAAVPEPETRGADGAGPGWFDSSWDLRCGLVVREGLPDDVGLREWLAAFCPPDGATAATASA